MNSLLEDSILEIQPFKSLTPPAYKDLCRLLIIFANSFDPDQARQYVGLDLDPNCLTV